MKRSKRQGFWGKIERIIMRNRGKIAVITLFIIVTAVLLNRPAGTPVKAQDTGELKGVWVSTVFNIDYPSVPSINSENLKKDAVKILDEVESMGLNAVFLQVRPCSDAIYKSTLYPWSKYLTGTQGTAPSDEFDPLKFWIDEAHKRNIQIHAWINPFRIASDTTSLDTLSPLSPARKNPSWAVVSKGGLYFNPGLPEVRKYIIDGVIEIISNYDVDGIHMDDYFYPEKSFNDAATYKTYGAGFTNVEDWRRDNVNKLIKDLYTAVKVNKPSVSFGVSPFGIWANSKSMPDGSNTNGDQSYFSHYADTKLWVKNGWLDYIAPQIYWEIGHKAADYATLTDWWVNVVGGTNVKLYIGHAAYKAGQSTSALAWQDPEQLINQLKYNQSKKTVSGSIFFSYKSLATNPLSIKERLSAWYSKDFIVEKCKELIINRFDDNKKIYTKSLYVTGSSNPDIPLYLDGVEITDRTPEGYFGALLSLKTGNNTFTFKQGSTEIKRTIVGAAPSSANLSAMSAAAISKSSVWPQSNVYVSSSQTVTFSCVAPSGSTVSVRIGQQIVKLKEVEKGSAVSGKITSAKFAGTYKFLPRSAGSNVVYIGSATYTATYKDKKLTSVTPGKVYVIPPKAPLWAKIIADSTNAYSEPSTGNGAVIYLNSGTWDYICERRNNFAKLSSGYWVLEKDINIISTSKPSEKAISSVSYEYGVNTSRINIFVSGNPVSDAKLENGEIIFRVYNTKTPAQLSASDARIKGINTTSNSLYSEYRIGLASENSIRGYTIETTADKITLNINWRNITQEAGTLKGIKIVLDPGHGGSDPGAEGMIGSFGKNEKDINLAVAMKLKEELAALGAEVILTRDSDVYLSLQEREEISRANNPDLFLSIHCNSMEEHVDMKKIFGFSVFYTNNTSKKFSDGLTQYITSELYRSNKGSNIKNFYVTRPTWTVSALMEMAFISNPHEYSWLLREENQNQMTKKVSEYITTYFAQ